MAGRHHDVVEDNNGGMLPHVVESSLALHLCCSLRGGWGLLIITVIGEVADSTTLKPNWSRAHESSALGF